MNKIIQFFLVVLMVGVSACNKETPDFPDFDYTSVYFPYQYPVRTLILGDYDLDNENDKNLRFKISARVAGMYENARDFKLNFVFDPSLANNISTSTGNALKILPDAYYTYSPKNELTIPKGSFIGDFTVQLTDAFLDDPQAFKTHYVLPFRITGSDADSVLSGLAAVDDPNPLIPAHWVTTPKNFTLFGIKFINRIHGKYLRRGRSILKNNAGVSADTVKYQQPYIEQDEVIALATAGRKTATLTAPLRASSGSVGNYSINIVLEDNNKGIIAAAQEQKKYC